jgi:hypothetical protein
MTTDWLSCVMATQFVAEQLMSLNATARRVGAVHRRPFHCSVIPALLTVKQSLELRQEMRSFPYPAGATMVQVVPSHNAVAR